MDLVNKRLNEHKEQKKFMLTLKNLLKKIFFDKIKTF